MSRLSSFRVLRLCRPERSASLSSCDAAGVRCRNPLDSVSRAGGNPEAPKGFGALRALVCPRGLDPRLRGKRGLEVRFQMGRARVSSPSPIASADCVSLIGSCVFPGRLAIIRRVAARFDQSIADAHSSVSSKGWHSEGGPIQFARVRAWVMRQVSTRAGPSRISCTVFRRRFF